MARSQSPGYPNFSLPRALSYVRSIHEKDRRNPIDREVAVKHMGYTSLSGASDKALGSLAHYDLTEKAGKGQVRVSQLAVDILHPAPGKSDARKKALLEAAFSPAIFADIRDQFADGTPSEATLKSWLTRENFLDRAINPVVSAYMETVRFLEQEQAFESDGPSPPDDEKSSPHSDSDVVFGGAKVGDLVQWESAGALQFEQPRRVRFVTDDAQWVAVEGSETGIPMSEVIVEQAAPRAQAPIIPMSLPPVVMKGPAPTPAATEDEGYEEWFRAKVGSGKQVLIRYRGEGDIGAGEIQKLIDILTAQKKVLDD